MEKTVKATFDPALLYKKYCRETFDENGVLTQ